eukprot:1193682-Pleurochrysis_carterae.AAC.1
MCACSGGAGECSGGVCVHAHAPLPPQRSGTSPASARGPSRTRGGAAEAASAREAVSAAPGGGCRRSQAGAEPSLSHTR